VAPACAEEAGWQANAVSMVGGGTESLPPCGYRRVWGAHTRIAISGIFRIVRTKSAENIWCPKRCFA
jgi:hypothetical protein